MTTWSTTDLSGTVALSGGNLTATGSGAQFQGVRSSTGKSSGKPYFELTVSSDPGSNGFGDAYWGLATSAQDFASDALFNAPSFAAITNIFFNSRFYCGDGSGSATEESIAGASGADGVSSTLSFAPDLTNGLIWYSTTEMRAEGFSWNWDLGAVPGSSGGLSLRGLQGNPMFAFFQAFFGYGVTANFGASPWAQAPPSGWTAWDPQGTQWAGAASISGTGSVSAAGLLRATGSARIAATAAVSAVPTGAQPNPFSADFSADFGAGVGAQFINWAGNALIVGVGSVRADAYLLRLSAQALTAGSATLHATAALMANAAGSIVGHATVGAAGGARYSATALILASSNLTVDSTVTLASGATTWNSGAIVAGAASVLAAASHSPAAISSIPVSANIIVDAVVSHTGHIIWQIAATIPVAGSLSATARMLLAARARIGISASVVVIPPPAHAAYTPITTAVGAPFYCVEISARQPGSGVVSMTLGWATTAWGTLNLKPSPIESSGVLLASDVGYRTAPSDPQRVVSYPPVLVSAFSLTRGMAIDPGGTASGWGWGSIALANDNGRFDGVASTWNNDGRPAIVLRGAKTWDDARGLWNDPAYGSLQNVFAGVSTPWRLDAATLTVPLRDATYWTERTIQILTYGGTGTYDGTAALKGSSLPKTRGGTAGAPILNVTPVLIDPVNLIWQYSDAPGTVVNLYEGAAKVFTADGDTSNLYSGSVASGHYRTDNSRALFQLGSSPALGRAITCDVTGQFPVGGVKTTPADIALWLLRDDMSVPIENIDVASFTAAALAYPYTAGIYFAPSDNPDGATAVSRVLAGIGAKLIPARSGQLGCFVLRALTGAETPAATLNTTNIVSLTPTALPAAVDPPPYRLRLAWGHNYTVQTSNINVATATAAQQQFVAQADTFSTWISNAVLGQYRRPNDPAPFGGTLCVEADADAVVSDLGALWGQPHTLCDVELPLQNGLAIDLGDVVQITYPIGGLRVGRFGTVVGERFNSGDPTVTLTVLVSPATAVATVQVGPGRSMLAPIVTVVARASLRARAAAVIGLSASVSVDSTVILAAGLSASAVIGVVGNVAVSAAARHVASARINGVASVIAAPSLTGAITAWSTTDHTPAITLSNINRTATATSEGAMVRSSGRAYTTGKVYVEFSSPVYTSDLSVGLSYQNGSLASIQIVTASGGGAITDTNGHVWTIVPTVGGQIAVDGVTDGTTSDVTLLTLVNGQVWQKNTTLNWFFKTLPTDTWGGPTTISPLPFVGETVDSVGFFPGRASQDLVLGNNNIDNWTGTAAETTGPIAMAADLAARKIWFSTPAWRTASTPWNKAAIGVADPAAGIGGIDISGIETLVGAVYLIAMSDDAANGAATLVTSGFALTVPTGFTGWDSGAGVVPPGPPTTVLIDSGAVAPSAPTGLSAT